MLLVPICYLLIAFGQYLLLWIGLPKWLYPWLVTAAFSIILWQLYPMFAAFVPYQLLRRSARGMRWRARVWRWRLGKLFRHAVRHAGPPSRPASQLETAAPILLHAYLAPAECQALWRTSRALARLVWQHAPTIRLSLRGGILGGNSLPWRKGRADACLQTLIASTSPPTFIPLPNTLQRIGALTLSGMRLSVDGLRALQLPHLHTLELQACELAASTAQPPPPVLRLRSLTCTSCKATQPLNTALSVVDQPSLQHLTTDDVTAYSVLPQLPALQRICITAGETTAREFDLLLAHPALREVCVRQLELKWFVDNHQPCSWRELRVLEFTSIQSVWVLPLSVQGPFGQYALGGHGSIRQLAGKYQGLWGQLAASGQHLLNELAISGQGPFGEVATGGGIQRCVVQQYIRIGLSESEQASMCRRLMRFPPSLVFQPTIAMRPENIVMIATYTAQDSLGLGLDEPGFEVSVDYVDDEATRALLQLVAKHLVGPGTLIIALCDLRNPEVLRSLQGLPPTITRVNFRKCHLPRDGPSSLFAHLPQHVGRIVVKKGEYESVFPTRVYHRGDIIGFD